MKIAKHYRPELVVSKGKEPNPLLTDPYLDSKAERLVSTNGHGLVALPVETEKEERSRYLACNLLKAARSFGEPLALAEIEDQEVVEYAGAPCPKHGTPAEAKRALIEKAADQVLEKAGLAELNKRELKGPAAAPTKGGRR